MKSIYTLFLGHRWLSLLWLMVLILPLRAQVPTVPVIQGQAIVEEANAGDRPVKLAKASSGDFGVLRGQILSFLSASGNLKSVNMVEGAIRTAGLAPTSDGGFMVLASSGNTLFVVKKNAINNLVWSRSLKTSTASDAYTPVEILPSPDGNFLIFAQHHVATFGPNTNVTKVDGNGTVLWSRDVFTNPPLRNMFSVSQASIAADRVTGAPDGSYLMTGFIITVIDRPPTSGMMVFRIDAEASVLMSRSYSQFQFTDQVANPAEPGTFFVLGQAADPTFGTFGGSVFPYKMQSDGSLVRLGRFTLNSRSRITGGGPGLPYFTVVEGYGTGGSDFIVSGANAQSEVYLSKVVGGSGADVPEAILTTTDGFLLGGTTTSTDGDIRGKQGNGLATWAIKLNIVPDPETPIIQPPNPFVLQVQAYDCNTGQLALALAGGNGSAVEYRIVGNRDWAANSLFTIPAHQRQGTTFTLEARQSGQLVSRGFTAACGPNTTPQPPTPPNPPGNPSGFFLRIPTYDCETGKLTAFYSNGTGGPVEYRIAGLRNWGTSEEFTVPPWQRIGTTFTIEARLTNGAMSTVLFTTACNAGQPILPTPGVPQFPLTLFFIGAPVNCSTGQLTVNVGGSNGTPLSYKIPGLADWQSSPVFVVPAYQRNGTTFTLFIRQSGQDIQASATVNCGNGGSGTSRVALPEIEAGLQVVVLGNPTTDGVSVVVSGVEGQPLRVELLDARGYTLGQRNIERAGAHETHTFELSQQAAGLFLVRAVSGLQRQTAKVIK